MAYTHTQNTVNTVIGLRKLTKIVAYETVTSSLKMKKIMNPHVTLFFITSGK